MKTALEASRFQFRRGEAERETSEEGGNLPEYGRFKSECSLTLTRWRRYY